MRRTCLLWIAIFCLGAALTHAGPAAAAKRALLVGINDYPFLEERHQLRGCENDVTLVRGILTTKYGFDAAKIKTLLSAEATRKGIIEAFQTHLIDQSQAGDMVLFHFSGHGSQVEDENKDEDDELDETLCPTDTNTNSPEPQIIDDEINKWIQALQAKGVKDIVFVLDCCHSGTATKGLLQGTGLSRPRYLDPFDVYKKPLIPKERALGDAPVSERAAEVGDQDVVVISGCKDAQQSNDAQLGGAWNGALTYFLSAVAQSTSPSATYDDVVCEVRRRVQEKYPTQTPQFQGPAGRCFLKGAEEVPARPFVVVTRADAEGVQIAAGAASGVTAGSTYTVYRGNDNRLSVDGIGTIEITKVDANAPVSTARVLRGGDAIRAGCRAVEETHFYPPDKLYVGIDAVGEAQIGPFVNAVKAWDYVELVPPGRGADRVIKVAQKGDGLSAQIVTPDGLPTRTFEGADAAELAARIKPEMDSAYVIKTLVRLDNPNPSFRVHIAIDREENPVYYFNPDKIGFRIRADRDCYVTVLDIGTSGRIQVLYPNRFARENKVLANQDYELPLPDRPTFQITVTEPVGREMVKVIATEEPLNLTGLDMGTVQEAFPGIDESMLFAKRVADKVRDFVVRARPPKPGAAPAAGTPTAMWSTDFVTFQIRDPKELGAARQQ